MKIDPMDKRGRKRFFGFVQHTCNLLLLGASATVIINTSQACADGEFKSQSEEALPPYVRLNTPLTCDENTSNQVKIASSASYLLVYDEKEEKAEALQVMQPGSIPKQAILDRRNLALYPSAYYEFVDDEKSVPVLVMPLTGGYSDMYTARKEKYRKVEDDALTKAYRDNLSPEYRAFDGRFKLADQNLQGPKLDDVKTAFDDNFSYDNTTIKEFITLVRSISAHASGQEMGLSYAPTDFEQASNMANPSSYEVRSKGIVSVITHHQAPFLMCPRTKPSEVKAIREALDEKGLTLTLLVASRDGVLITNEETFYNAEDKGPFVSDTIFKIDQYCHKYELGEIKVVSATDADASEGYFSVSSETKVANHVLPVAVTMSGSNIDLISALSPPPAQQAQHIKNINTLSDARVKEGKKPVVAFFTQKNDSDLEGMHKIASNECESKVHPIPYLGRDDGDQFAVFYYFLLNELRNKAES